MTSQTGFKVIALAGSKGGSGKSTLSHLLAHGAGLLPRAIPAAVVTTDPEDRLLEDQRRYLVVDGRTPARLADELERLLPVERPLVVIDGAAARSDLDAVMSRVADLVVVPALRALGAGRRAGGREPAGAAAGRRPAEPLADAPGHGEARPPLARRRPGGAPPAAVPGDPQAGRAAVARGLRPPGLRHRRTRAGAGAGGAGAGGRGSGHARRRRLTPPPRVRRPARARRPRASASRPAAVRSAGDSA